MTMPVSDMDEIYIVTDIESDGPSPLRNSMLSFASVAMTRGGQFLGEFQAVLEPRKDRVPDPKTMEWWKTEPEAYKAATENAQSPEKVMKDYAAWVKGFEGRKVFAAAPLIFDGLFIDHYLDLYTRSRVFAGPTHSQVIFSGGAADIYTMSGILAGVPHQEWTTRRVPDSWIGFQPHSHFAIDDARGFAHLLKRFFIVSGLPQHLRQLEISEFGDSKDLCDELVGLIVAGKKTATCGALAHYEADGEPLPQVGQRYIVPNWDGVPQCIIETTSVEVKRFDEVDEDFARAEGEGDLSYQYWHDGHKDYFTRNGGFAPEMKLVCERFKLIEVLADQTTTKE
ncbi:uncharacterized protein YhfF [Maritalea mobilis]|uniref:Uncharacterized protein YhfF n=2 Tax=Maritalea mobilis TaxID=483324 RepID=A0A4R6VQG5_9HYPH|nr:uncharacterized protein YhfF [Maritalea mobilis]